jgi:hypothetical protein
VPSNSAFRRLIEIRRQMQGAKGYNADFSLRRFRLESRSSGAVKLHIVDSEILMDAASLYGSIRCPTLDATLGSLPSSWNRLNTSQKRTYNTIAFHFFRCTALSLTLNTGRGGTVDVASYSHFCGTESC